MIFGPYTSREIEGEGLYWDAHNFKESIQKFLEFASDPNFNGPLPQQALSRLCEALKQGASGWEKEIGKVDLASKGHSVHVGLKAGQWDTYKRLFYAGLPDKA